ncbi:unnamed protein product, partial [Staurois parvus]
GVLGRTKNVVNAGLPGEARYSGNAVFGERADIVNARSWGDQIIVPKMQGPGRADIVKCKGPGRRRYSECRVRGEQI